MAQSVTSAWSSEDQGPYLVASAAVAEPASASPRTLVPLAPQKSTWGVALKPGQSFAPGEVAAIIASVAGHDGSQGEMFVMALPNQYFDTTPGGVKIRLRRQPGTQPFDQHDSTVQQWNAVGQVLRIVSATELLQRQQEPNGPPLITIVDPPALSSPPLASKPSPTASWLAGLIIALVVAAIGIASLIAFGVIAPNLDPALAMEQFMAVAGGVVVAIFGLTCVAFIVIAMRARS